MNNHEKYPDSNSGKSPRVCTRAGPYLLMETIGYGTTSKVKVAVHRASYERFACKIMDKSEIRANANSPQLQKEIRSMRQLSHKNVVTFETVLTTETKVYIVMELVEGVELFREIENHTRLAEPYARLFFTQLIDGIQHCHQRGVYHRDLKPENLMITKDKVLKITDFGLSNLKEAGGGTGSMDLVTGSLSMKTQCGTPNYVAPEIITLDNENGPNSYSGSKVDIWACGVILFTLVAGYLPFDSSQTDILFKSILRARVNYPDWFSPDLIDLLSNMLKIAPRERYTLNKIRRHPWFNGKIQLTNSTDIDGNISEAIPQPQEGKASPRSISHDNLNHAESPHPCTHGCARTGTESRLAIYSVQKEQVQHVEYTAKTQRTADSLDFFGIRVDTAEGELDTSCLDDILRSEEEAAPKDESVKVNAASSGEQSSSSPPGTQVDSNGANQKARSSSPSAGSTVGEEQDYDSEEAEEVRDPSSIRAHMALGLPAENSGGQGLALMRRACSLENLASIGRRAGSREPEELGCNESKSTTEHLSVRGLVKRQLWDRAAEFQSRELVDDSTGQVRLHQNDNVECIRRLLSMDTNATADTHTRRSVPDLNRQQLRRWSHDGVVTLPIGKKIRRGRNTASMQVAAASSAAVGTVGQRTGGFEDDKAWVGSEDEKILWCRVMRDFDMVPDYEEFNMDSCQLNEIWTEGLARENLAPDSFSASRFITPSFTPSRSTRYLSGAATQSIRDIRPVAHSVVRKSRQLHSPPRDTKKGNCDTECTTPGEDFQYQDSATQAQETHTGDEPTRGPKRRERGKMLSAMPSHIIQEMVPNTRGVSLGRFSPNGRTPVTRDGVGDVFAAEEPHFRQSKERELRVEKRFSSDHPSPTDPVIRVKLGEGTDVLPFSGSTARAQWNQEIAGGNKRDIKESRYNGKGVEVDQYMGSQESAEPLSTKGSMSDAVKSYHQNGTSASAATTSSGRTTARDEADLTRRSESDMPVSPYTPGIENGGTTASVKPFEIDIPGPPVNAAPPSTKRSLTSFLPNSDSVRRWLKGKPGSPFDSKSFTQFQSHLSPERSYSVIKKILVDNGCAFVKGRPSRSGDKFTIRCEYKRAKESILVISKITISKFDDVLSAILFEKKGRTKDEHFAKFYASVYDLYCKAV